MPYLQPGTNNYFGFMPLGLHNARTNVYLVSSSEAQQISPGDVVMYATGSTDAAGTRTVRRAVGTEATPMVGVAASIVLANGGSSAASLRSYSSQNVLVYDDPLTLFVGCDTTSGVLGVGTHMGKSVRVTATGVVGSTGPRSDNAARSVMACSIVTASSQGIFRIIGLHPIETGLSTTASATAVGSSEVRKLILACDMHVNAGFGAGVGNVTT